MEFPVGYKFVPTNFDVISCLLHKLQYPDDQSDFIKDERIYAITPESLNWDPILYVNDYERYYFVKRNPVGKEKQKNAKRSLETGEGYWRKSRDDPIFDSQNLVVGDVALLNFFRDDLATKQRSSAVKTRFVMHEFTLRSDTFQEWVVCRIKDKEREKKGKRRNQLPQPPDDPPPLEDAMDSEEGVVFETEEMEDSDEETMDSDSNDDRLMFTYEELLGSDDVSLHGHFSSQ